MKNKSQLRSLTFLLTFTVLSVALLLFLDKEEAKNGWRKDFSFNAFTSTSEETQKLLASVQSEVYLYTFQTQSSRDELVQTLLQNYTGLNPHLHYENISLSASPNFLSNISGLSLDSLEAESILIYSPINKRFRLLQSSDLIGLSYDIEKGNYNISDLRYEKRITESILFVNNANVSKIYVLNGHGEPPASQMEALYSHLQLNAYEIHFSAQVPQDIENDALLMIHSPKKDLSAQEIQNLVRFENEGGSILLSLNYDSPTELPNLFAFLESFGITVLDGHVIADSEERASYYQDVSYLIPYMNTTAMLSPLIEKNQHLLLMPLPKAFSLQNASHYQNTPLLFSGKKSERIDSKTSQKLAKEEMILAAHSEKEQSNGQRSQLIVLGSTHSISDEYIYSISFVGEFIQTILNQLLPQKQIETNIAVKAALRPNLMIGNKNLGIAIIVLLPLSIALIGILHIAKRKSL